MRFECRQLARTQLTFQLVDVPAVEQKLRLRELATSKPVSVPVLAVDAGGGPFTAATDQQVTTGDITSVRLEGVGHYAALEAPAALSTAILEFLDSVDAT